MKQACRPAFFLLPRIGFVLLAGSILAGQVLAYTDTQGCSSNSKVSDYQPAPSDIVEATHLRIERTFTGKGSLEVNICAGDIRIVPSTDGLFKLDVELRTQPEKTMSAFVQHLDVKGNQAKVSLLFPK